jgi:hypothetical protein
MQANLFLKLICYPLCRCCGLILELKTRISSCLASVATENEHEPHEGRSFTSGPFARDFLVVPKSYAAGLKMYCPGGALFQTGQLKSPVHDYEQLPCQTGASAVTSAASRRMPALRPRGREHVVRSDRGPAPSAREGQADRRGCRSVAGNGKPAAATPGPRQAQGIGTCGRGLRH